MRPRFRIKCSDCGTIHSRHKVYGKPCKRCGGKNLVVVAYK